jgi:hypothetical protein
LAEICEKLVLFGGTNRRAAEGAEEEKHTSKESFSNLPKERVKKL